MDRKEFIKNSAILGGATILPINNVFSQSVNEASIDKLVDSNGNFIQKPLPYKKTFLEPYMDEETLHLHYEFHHGGAVKGAYFLDKSHKQEKRAQGRASKANRKGLWFI